VHRYGVREVEKLLRLPRSTIRALIRAGFVAPERGPRRAWLFSFQDLIILRTAQALAAAKVPGKRITRSMRELRRHLPESMPLSGLSISAEADRVVVREGAARWQAESGQYLLAFGGDPANGSLTVMEKASKVREMPPDYAELGATLHESGNLAAAEKAYRDGIRADGEDPVLFYNLALVLEDLQRNDEALTCYQASLGLDPRFADCHYNIALLYEARGSGKEALRHMAQYRRLTAKK
jgi:tetratricopeptide (TPR) repeat protein